MENQYTYAVARVKSKENSLLTNQDYEQLLSAKSLDEAVRFLSDKGFEGLSEENKKLWDFIFEVVPDKSAFDIFLYPRDFHNLKAAVKSVLGNVNAENIYMADGTVSTKLIIDAIKERNFLELPNFLRSTAEEISEILLKTNDARLCDVIADQMALVTIKNEGDKSENKMLSDYAESYVALADIKIALRACRLKKSADFLNRAIAPCSTLNTVLLIKACESIDSLSTYISTTPYSESVAYFNDFSAFEKWSDDYLMELAKKQKYNFFTIAPIIAYILARESEIKTVRIILSGIQNDLDTEIIKERLRKAYV